MQVWLVGDGVTDEEQMKAQKGSHFVPYSQFPPNKARNDCVYHCTPALLVPESFENLHVCEVLPPYHLLRPSQNIVIFSYESEHICTQNWLPRRVMSAWRAAGIVHALEKWDGHECGGRVTGVQKAWSAALARGFRPYDDHHHPGITHDGRGGL